MRIITLLENTSLREDLRAEHGLSLCIEACGRRILFDAGQSDAFARNAEKLGVDLSRVDLMVLSHGHYDHGGGIREFLRLNRSAPVYANPGVFLPHYNGTQKYIGLDPELRGCGRFCCADEVVDLGGGLRLIPGRAVPQPFGAEPYGLTVLENGVFRPDDFLHEQYLECTENGRKILFSGCSHRGIRNITDFFRPDVLVGGFHFTKLDPEGAGAPVLRENAEALLRYPTVYYTCHCTGAAQYAFLKPLMGDRLHGLSTGSVLEL